MFIHRIINRVTHSLHRLVVCFPAGTRSLPGSTAPHFRPEREGPGRKFLFVMLPMHRWTLPRKGSCTRSTLSPLRLASRPLLRVPLGSLSAARLF